MIKRLARYAATALTPLDYLRPLRRKRGDIHVGWCSVFPPTPNGAATLAHTVIRRLAREPGICVSAIPYGGRIDKRLFPRLHFTTVNDRSLDVVIFFCLGPHIAPYLRRARAKRTLVWQTAHESITADEREAALFEIVRKADGILTMSRSAFEEYRLHGADNAAYLPAGVDTDIFSPRSRQGGPLRVLCATRIHYYKGVSAYLDSITLILRRRPDIRFTLHGPIDMNTNYYAEITGRIEETKARFPANFSYQGQWLPPEEVPGIFRAADLFVFPSDNEGFGVPLIEAMSCGMPCIVMDKAPMNEIVRDRVTGCCLPVGSRSRRRYHGYRFPSPEDIAGAVLAQDDCRQTHERMSLAARQRALEEYSLEGCMRGLTGHIRRLLSEGSL